MLQVFRAVQRHITSQRVSTGSWSSWSGWSRCSSTCGRGLRTQVRTCVGHGKTNLCRGVSSRHHVCDNRPCKAERLTHNSQCSEFDKAGQTWVSRYNYSRPVSDRCRLVCQDRDRDTVSKDMGMVRDGTDCMPRDRHTVCVRGECKVRKDRHLLTFPFTKKWPIPLIHGHISLNQMNQNVEPKTFFQKGKLRYLAEIRECWVSRRKSYGYLIQSELFEQVTTNMY